MKVKEKSEKAGLKLNIQKTKIMASSPITSWQIDGENVATVSDFIFLGSKINVDGDGSHKIKRRLLLGRKAMKNLDSYKKQRHHFSNKGPYSQSYVFSNSHVQMWELDHKEAEHRIIDAFKLCGEESWGNYKKKKKESLGLHGDENNQS